MVVIAVCKIVSTECDFRTRGMESTMNERNTTYEEELREHGRLVYRNKGVSMLPMLRQDRDLMVIESRPSGEYKKYEVVLYKKDDQYILHRILKVLPDGYEICGDHNWRKDPVVKKEQILGVLTSFVRDGKEISTDAFLYKSYVHLWCDVFPVRAFLLRARRKLGRIKRKLTG